MNTEVHPVAYLITAIVMVAVVVIIAVLQERAIRRENEAADDQS